MKSQALVIAAVLTLCSATAIAGEWTWDFEVTKIGTYQHGAAHFDWFSSRPG